VSADLAGRPELNQLLAKVLHRGTWLGWSVIALGLALPMTGWSRASSTMICTRIVTSGIALIIALPVLRVFLMLVVFVRERDFLFSAIAMLVLAIILLGSVLGAFPFVSRSRQPISHNAPNVSRQYVCDDHPAHTGHRLIAKTIAHAVRTLEH
jgi:uncharacterized protein DUF1634